MSQRYNYRAFTKDFIIGNVALKIADVVGSEEVFADVKAKLAGIPKNELIEKFAETYDYSWQNKQYSFIDKNIYQYAIDEKFITPHDLAISANSEIREWCASLGYEHELLAKDEKVSVRSAVLYNTKDPHILSILWDKAAPLDSTYNCAKVLSKEHIMRVCLYGIDAGVKTGNLNLISDLIDSLQQIYDDAGNYKYQTFQEYFEAHPEMCVLPENRKAKKVAEAVAPKRDIMKNAQVADKVAGQDIHKKK